MVKISRRSLLLCKTESVHGTDPTPTASDNAILTQDLEIKPIFDAIERNVSIGSISRKPSLGAMRHVEVTFKNELIGSGAAGTAPRIGSLFKAAAFAETVSAGSSVIYTPNSSPIASCTLYIYKDGIRHIVTGALGSVKGVFEAGKQAFLEWSFKGIYNTPTDTALPTPTFESQVDSPPIVRSANFTWNSINTLVVKMFDFDMQNTVAIRPSINAEFAMAGMHITDRKPIFSMDPEAEALATIDWYADILTTPRTMSMQIGEDAGNICTITSSKCNVVSVEYGDREGTLIQNIKGELTSISGDDEISFRFT